MSLLTAKGSFAARTSSGAQSVSGLGFTPKAVIFWLTKQTATGYAAGRALSIGFTDGTNQRVLCGVGNDGAVSSTNVAGRSTQSDRVIYLINHAAGVATTDIRAGITSLDAGSGGGFTLDWVNAAAGKDYLIHYLALGGTDLTNAWAGTINSPVTTGNVGHTGVGFQPDCVLTLTTANSALGDATGSRIDIGAAASTSQQACLAFVEDDTINTVVGTRQIVAAMVDSDNSAGTPSIQGTLVSFDADGLTINWTAVQASQRIVFVLALKGGRYWVGTDTQKTSTGTQAKTGVGFQPTGLMLMGVNQATSTTFNSTAAKVSIGASDGTNEGSVWFESTDNVATSDENSATLTDKILRHATNPSTTNAEADLSSLDGDGYTLNWSTADGTAREFIAVAFGNPAGMVLKPSADSVDGAWTDDAAGTALAAAIDEDVASDTDYIQSEDNPVDSRCRVKLSTAPDPGVSTGHIIYWRVKKDTAGTMNMKVTLRQGGGNSIGGGTLIAEFTRNDVPSTFTTYTETLSGAEADSITNYSDLYLEFYADIP